MRLLAFASVFWAMGCTSELPPANEGPDRCPGARQYTDGMVITGVDKKLALAWLLAAPSPPDVGLNRWQVRVRDVDDAALPVVGPSGSVTPAMDHHGHGTYPEQFIGEACGEGCLELGPMNLMMPGLWTFRLRMGGQVGSKTLEDTAIFRLCLQG